MAGHKKAFVLLKANDPKARQAFAGLVGEFEGDPLTLFHLGRLLSGGSGVVVELGEK